MGVVAAGAYGIENLPRHNQRGIAGVVVDAAQSRIDGGASVVAENFNAVPLATEHGLYHLKVDRQHLRREDGVALPLHFAGEHRAGIRRGNGSRYNAALLPLADGGNQRTHADAGGAEVADLVDLQKGVQLVARLQNFRHLIGGDGIQPAAEGVELDQLQILPAAHKLRGGVQTGVIAPLIRDAQRAFGGIRNGQTVLGQHGEAVGGDHLGDAVVDLRIGVIGAAAEYNAAAAVRFHPVERPFALGADIRLGAQLFRPRLAAGGAHLVGGNLPFLRKHGAEPILGGFFVAEGEKRMDKADVLRRQILNVVADIFRRTDDHGAVVFVLRPRLRPLKEYAGIEYGMYARVDQRLNVSVRQLGGVALAFGGDGFHAPLIDPAGAFRGEHDRKAEHRKQRRPKRVIFIQVQRAGNTDHAARRFFGGQGRVIEDALILIGGQIRHGLRLRRFFARAALTAVAGNVPPPVREAVDRQQTAVLAALAAGDGRGVGERGDAVKGQQRAVLTFAAPLPRNERRAKRPHETGDVRADDLGSGGFFQRAQNRVIAEGAALDENVPSE